MLTVFTPTYNRAHLLPRLYRSLLAQTCHDIEWIIVNDGSTDNTDSLIRTWEQQPTPFPIRCFNIRNGGKQRAINLGVTLADGEYFFIVDSDDVLLPDAVEFVYDAFSSLPKENNSFIGISSFRGDLEGKPLGNIDFRGQNWVDASNLERANLGLNRDMAEVFFTEKLKQYPFPVWEGETFTPEEVVWDQMALDGYRLRWFYRVTYLCDYQQEGLSNSSWSLLKNNPMGYAMLFNMKLASANSIRQKVSLTLQFLSCCFLANNSSYIKRCKEPYLAYILSPLGYLLSIRRKRQFKVFL